MLFFHETKAKKQGKSTKRQKQGNIRKERKRGGKKKKNKREIRERERDRERGDIYIYICCEVIIWAKFGHFRCYYLGQVGVIIWAKLFLAYKNSGFKRFFAHTVII